MENAPQNTRGQKTELPELFHGLTQQELDRVLETTPVLDVVEGQQIIKQGEYSDEAYVVLEGSFRVQVEAGGRMVRLDTFGPGSIFGEMAQFQDNQRTATVVSMTDGRVLLLSNNLIEQLRRVDPNLSVKLLRNLLRILCKRLTAANNLLVQDVDRELFKRCELFEDLAWSEIELLWNLFPIRIFQANETVFQKGDTSREAYVVIEGELQVRFHLKKHSADGTPVPLRPVVAKVGPGAIVGEFALIDGEPRSAEVFCPIVTRTLEINTRILERIRADYPLIGQQIQRNLARIMVKRVRSTGEKLASAIEWGWKAYQGANV